MNKKILSVLMVCILALGFTVGCQSQGAGESGANSEPYKVAFIARSQQDHYAVWLANEMTLAAEKYPDIQLDIFDGQGDDDIENKAIEDAIAAGYDAIIVQPNNGEAQRAYVEKIVESGIIAVTTNSRIEGIEGASSVDSDPYAQAMANIEGALTAIPENAKVVILKGPVGNYHADERYKAWKAEFFRQRPDVTVVAEDFANWDKGLAKDLMTEWSADSEPIQAIIAMNDNMAIGAWEAIKDNPVYDATLIYGVDGIPIMCSLIETGEITSTCLQSAIELAEANMETVHQLLTGEETKINKSIRTTVINKVNVEKYIEQYTERGLIAE